MSISEPLSIGLHTARGERPESSDREGVQREKLPAHAENLLHIHTIDMGKHFVPVTHIHHI